MRLPRFTVRTLMVTVAIVALAFPLYRTIIFYKKYYNMAIFHSESEKYYALQRRCCTKAFVGMMGFSRLG